MPGRGPIPEFCPHCGNLPHLSWCRLQPAPGWEERQERKVSIATRRRKVLELLKRGEWVATAEINAVGGTEGTRRLRELRDQGMDIRKRRKAESDQYEYRLFEEGQTEMRL